MVFVQNDKWRLSFISEIRVLNDDGTIDKRATEPKRYTYLLGRGEKTKTPTDRLSSLANKKIALEDIRAAFSVEALNNEFYKQISTQFYELVGATTTKGKTRTTHERILQLPGASEETAANRELYQKFAVRLIGRTVFCWFLKVKKSENGKPLLPENLLSSDAVRKNKNYYHTILEPLFFQTLNTPMNERIEDLPEGCEIIPFLNGGLFEPQTEDFYNAESRTENYQNYALKIPDSWFEEFFTKLEQYNFTIDENSPTEVEISVDPEMLGRIFENLLAEIDPDSGETARKATGSFYTPREIVNYMVDESLLIYLKSKLQAETAGYQSLKTPQATFGGNDWRDGQLELEYPLDKLQKPARSKGADDEAEEHTYSVRVSAKDAELETALRELFSYSDNKNPFDESDTKRLIEAIDDCKILDPACGSGAFPIGVLQRLVHLLGKLDPKTDGKPTKWQELQRAKTLAQFEEASRIEDRNQRDARLLQISEAFEKDSSDFGRKLFLIENCIYGVDIQPIAAEISKLRCFLTLIVDEDVNDNVRDNRGVNPLPNLEFKFVTADALLKLPERGLFNSDQQIGELETIRHEYINAYGAGKESAKRRFKQIQDAIFDQQIKNHRDHADKRAIALATWNPFGHEKVDWFDSLWMFGVKAFDIVIGNPPYGAKLTPEQIEKYKHIFQLKTTETAILFIERGYEVLKKDGIENYIIPKSFAFASNYGSTRDFVSDELNILGDCGKAFDNVKLEACIIQIKKGVKLQSYHSVKYENDRTFKTISNIDKKIKKLFGFFPNGIEEKEIKTGMKILQIGQNLNDIANNSRGEMIQKFINEKGDVPVIGGKEINKYGIRSYKGFLPNSIVISDKGRISRNSVLAQNIIAHITKPTDHIKIIACIPQNKSAIISDTINQISIFNENYSNKFIWTVLNSKVVNWYAYRFIFGKAIRTMHFDNAVTSRIPVPIISKEKQKPFENLVDYILFLKEMSDAEQVNEYVPNSHLVEQFEEVIDALVYELYFEEDFRQADIAFQIYAARDFPPIAGCECALTSCGLPHLSREQKAKTIHEAYQRLRQKDNPIRNNLKLMDIRLSELIMPIKTAR